MKLHCLNDIDYNELIFKLLLSNNPFTSTLSISSTGYPTIGYNFNLQDDRTLLPVLNSLGFDVYEKRLSADALAAEKYYIDLIRSALKILNSKDTESLNNVIQSILSARLTDKRYRDYPDFKRAAQFIYDSESDFVVCLGAIVKNYEKTVDQWLMSFDLEIINQTPQLLARKTQERAVLFSLAQQGLLKLKPHNKPTLQPLGDALAVDNRAEAWYQIRYACFAQGVKDVELVKRRYYESELFGLYDSGTDGNTISSNKCKEIYSMFHEYKDSIMEHERHYSVKITDANLKYKLSGDAAIKTLEQSFSIAYNHVRSSNTLKSPIVSNSRSSVKPNGLDKVPVLTPWKPVSSKTTDQSDIQQYHGLRNAAVG
ncbi:hypothetical protein [Kaarinaea lacus]